MAVLKLTDLPIELQAHILDKLPETPLSSRPAPSSTKPSKRSCVDLPEELLHAAQASKDLAKAAVVALGPHARYLNFFQTKWVWKWIPILKGHVRAIDIAGVDAWSYGQDNCDQKSGRFESSEVAILETLKTLSTNEVELEELNLENMDLITRKSVKEVADYMAKAVQRCSPTLRMIGLRANKASVLAMKTSTLPKLKTVHISANVFSHNYEVHMPNTPSRSASDEAICQILKAISANAGSSGNISTVRELSLSFSVLYVSKICSMEFESCPRLFLGVKKLVLKFHQTSDYEDIAKFISNFKTLESLCWHRGSSSDVRVQDTKTMFEACPHLQELRLVPCFAHNYNPPDGIGIARELFLSFRGRLQTADFGYLTKEQIKVLGESSPNLRTLYMKIDQTNITALPSLFGNRCRPLRQLRLVYSGNSQNCLLGDGWSALSNAVRCAPPCLRTISLVGNELDLTIDSGTEDMVDAIIGIIECMGDRAATVIFSVPMRTTSPLVILKGLSRTLESAVIHCKSIEKLCLNFVHSFPEKVFVRNVDEEDGILHWYKAVCAFQVKLSGQLEDVDIGNVETLLEWTK